MTRGEIYLVDFKFGIGSEQGGTRPAVIISNNMANNYSPVIIVAPITSRTKNNIPTHVLISGEHYGLEKDSIILCEQIRCIDKTRVKMKIGNLSVNKIQEVDHAIEISLGL